MRIARVRCVATYPVTMRTFTGDQFVIAPLQELDISEEYLYCYKTAEIRVLFYYGDATDGGNGGGDNGGGDNGGGTGDWNPDWDGGNTIENPNHEDLEDYPFVTHTTSLSGNVPQSGLWHKNVIVWNGNPTPETFIGYVVVTEGAAVSGEWATGVNYPVGTWVSYNGAAFALSAKTLPTLVSGIPPTKASSGSVLADGLTWLWKRDQVAGFMAFGPILDEVPGTIVPPD